MCARGSISLSFSNREAFMGLKEVVGSYLPDLVFGANDGIVTTLVVIASMTGVAMSTSVMLKFGVPNLLADGFSMGTSNVLSIRSMITAATRPSLGRASRNGLATFTAFVAAGLLPIPLISCR